MGIAREPAAVKYFAALLLVYESILAEVETELAVVQGAIESRSSTFPWEFSRYYENEMGTGLLRRFIAFTPIASPENLAGLKRATQNIEDRYRGRQGGRRVNLDPGYLDAYKVVLASTKNAGQRIYLSAGIYAEVTLLFHNAAFQGLEYTYRDYLASEALEFFFTLRARYLDQLRTRD